MLIDRLVESLDDEPAEKGLEAAWDEERSGAAWMTTGDYRNPSLLPPLLPQSFPKPGRAPSCHEVMDTRMQDDPNHGLSRTGNWASNQPMKDTKTPVGAGSIIDASIRDTSVVDKSVVDTSIFDEQYRVVGVESQRLTIRGIRSGTVLTITNSDAEMPLTPAEYPVGKRIALSDPSSAALD